MLSISEQFNASPTVYNLFFFSIWTAFPNLAFSTGVNSLRVLGYAWLAMDELYCSKYAFGYNSLVNFETRAVAEIALNVVF